MSKLYRKDFVAMAESISQSAAIIMTDTTTPVKAAKQAGELVVTHINHLRTTNPRFSSTKYHDYVMRRLGELGVNPKRIKVVSKAVHELCDLPQEVS